MDSQIALLQQWAAALALWRGFQNDRSVWACWPVPAHKPTLTIGRLHAGRPLQAISRLLCPHAWHRSVRSEERRVGKEGESRGLPDP